MRYKRSLFFYARRHRHSCIRILNVFEGPSRLLTCSNYCRFYFHIAEIVSNCLFMKINVCGKLFFSELAKINKQKNFKISRNLVCELFGDIEFKFSFINLLCEKIICIKFWTWFSISSSKGIFWQNYLWIYARMFYLTRTFVLLL